MRKWLFTCVLMLSSPGIMQAQYTSDILGMHDLSRGLGSPIQGGLPACLFCHAPHSGLGNVKALWSQSLSTMSYTLYAGTLNPEQQPVLGSGSNLCLSCHDGTVAVGQTTPYGKIQMQGSMNPQDVFGASLQSVHPFNFKLPLDPNTPNLLPQVIAGTGTGNSAVKLIDGNVQCTSCHDPHNETLDLVALKFLVMDNSGSGLCLSCHTTTPSSSPMARLRAAKTSIIASGTPVPSPQPAHANSLLSWSSSAHATASHKVSKSAGVGGYGIVSRNGCQSCHTTHNGMGGKNLLSGPVPSVPNMDAATQNCITCHNGGLTVTPAIANVFSEFAKTGHTFPTGSNRHLPREDAVLDNNRHATCVDCHNPHAARRTESFVSTGVRESQAGVTGVSPTDGTTVPNAVDQYQTCLRCHGTSAGKQTLTQFGYLPAWAVSAGDPLNIIPQFNRTATSKHPVMQDRSSALPQPSLLQYMWNQNGTVQGRAMGTRMLCSDCHNSDDNREFGGTGPNGPHGSQYTHIFERRYEMSQVAPKPAGGPGTAIQNLFLSPILTPACSSYPCVSPYALCAKCHDLSNVLSNASFSQHARHINDGFSCSTCHTAHGIGATSASVSGERLVNFDVNVVGSNGGAPISYLRGKNTCTLTCHNAQHNSDGSVSIINPVPKVLFRAK